MSKFSEYYELLEISQDDSWQKVRSAYKYQMKKWHPDRFSNDTDTDRHAEEMAKRVNQAYQELLQYYETNGRLPTIDVPSKHVVEPNPDLNPTFENITDSEDNHSINTTAINTAAQRHEPRNKRIPTFVLLVIFIVAIWLLNPNNESTEDRASDDLTIILNAEKTADPVSHDRVNREQISFTAGSTVGEVISIQGVPTKVDGDIWYYKTAQVVFENGRVIRWIDSIPPLLRVSGGTYTEITIQKNMGDSIRIGSTKEEVRSIQGIPTRETHKKWYYGKSHIEFDQNGHVSGWAISPYHPIRTLER